jgi:hypothetical protein
MFQAKLSVLNIVVWDSTVVQPALRQQMLVVAARPITPSLPTILEA